MGVDIEVSSRRKIEDRYFGLSEVDRKMHGKAYILEELDGIEFRRNPTSAFCLLPYRLLPYITQDHWFMKHSWLNNEEGDSDSDNEGE